MRVVALLPMLLAACVPMAAPETASSGTVSVRLGETARLGGVRVRPIAVLEDSRCPLDVICVWAGRLRLRVRISGVTGETELILGQAFPLSPTASLSLVSATPAPKRNPAPGTARGPASRFGFRLN